MNARYVRQFDVGSFTKPDQKPYKVSERADGGGWECSCPAWTMHTPRSDCKHIDLIRKDAAVAAAFSGYRWDRPAPQKLAPVRAGKYTVQPRSLSDLDLVDATPVAKPRRGGRELF
jgi:hypothetical protein